jgi:hypothetical protein
MYQMWFYMSSCCFVNKMHIWHFGMVNFTWWKKIDLWLYDLLYN